MIFIVHCNVELVLIMLLHLPHHYTPVTVIVVCGPMPYIQEQVEPFLFSRLGCNWFNSCVCDLKVSLTLTADCTITLYITHSDNNEALWVGDFCISCNSHRVKDVLLGLINLFPQNIYYFVGFVMSVSHLSLTFDLWFKIKKLQMSLFYFMLQLMI